MAGGIQAGQLSIELVAEIAKLQEDMRKVERSVGQMADGVNRKTRAVNDNFGKLGKSSRLASHHVQNLAFQFQDIAIGLQGGQRPMTVFLQQGSQIAGVMGQAGIGVGGLVKQIGSMIVGFLRAHPLLAALGVAATAVAGAFKLFSSEVAKSGELDRYAQSLGLTKKEMKELEGVGVTASDVFVGLYRTFDQYLGLTDIFNTVKNAVVIAFKFMLEAGKIAAAGIYSAFVGTARAAAQLWGALKSGDFSKLDMAGAYTGAFNDARTGLGNFGDILGQNIRGAARDRLKAQADAIIADRNATAATKARTAAVNELAKALDDLLDRLLKPERDQAQRNSEFDLLAKEIAKAEAAGVKALPRLIELERALDRLRGEGIDQSKKELSFKDPGSLVEGLPDIAKQLSDSKTREMDEFAKATELANDQLREMINLLGNLGRVGSAIGGLLGILTGKTSAIGGPLGEILNIGFRKKVTTSTGETEYVARTIGEEVAAVFNKDSDFFRNLSSILQGAGTGLIAGNALGFTGGASQIGSAIGGSLGQALGEKFLTAGLNKVFSGLGSAAGPLGAIAGGLLGGALGSLFGKTPKGSATIGGVNGVLGISGTSGNSQARIAAATKSANAIIDSLDSLAAELGATIDPSRGSVSIGIRKGSYRVDTSGQGITKKKRGAIDFGEDAEAAAYFAMLDLIKDGVLVGLRKGTETLLKNADDLEKGIQKALAFEGVFKELRALKDPIGAALDDLDREFSRLEDIFAEAGASLEDYAALEELYTLKRQEALEAAQKKLIDDQRDRIDLEVEILQLLGREEEALALARQTELATMKASLRPLQEMVYQLQDARSIIEQFGPLADDLREFKKELLGSSARNGFAFIAAQFRSTADAAAGGDAGALASLRGVSTEFLDAARANASSKLEYDRAVGQVLSAVDSGIFAADAQVEYAQMQIDAINAQTTVLQGLIERTNIMQERMIAQGEWIERYFRRVDGNGMLIRSDEDTPIYTQEIV